MEEAEEGTECSSARRKRGRAKVKPCVVPIFRSHRRAATHLKLVTGDTSGLWGHLVLHWEPANEKRAQQGATGHDEAAHHWHPRHRHTKQLLRSKHGCSVAVPVRNPVVALHMRQKRVRTSRQSRCAATTPPQKAGRTHPRLHHALPQPSKRGVAREPFKQRHELLSKFLAILEHEAIHVALHQLAQAVEAHSANLSDSAGKAGSKDTKLQAFHGTHRKMRTGSPQPNMSTTFMGRSRPDDEVCRQTPRSALPRSSG